MTSSSFSAYLPRWGRASSLLPPPLGEGKLVTPFPPGGGQGWGPAASPLERPPAPIPTFPQRGKGQEFAWRRCAPAMRCLPSPQPLSRKRARGWGEGRPSLLPPLCLPPPLWEGQARYSLPPLGEGQARYSLPLWGRVGVGASGVSTGKAASPHPSRRAAARGGSSSGRPSLRRQAWNCGPLPPEGEGAKTKPPTGEGAQQPPLPPAGEGQRIPLSRKHTRRSARSLGTRKFRNMNMRKHVPVMCVVAFDAARCNACQRWLSGRWRGLDSEKL